MRISVVLMAGIGWAVSGCSGSTESKEEVLYHEDVEPILQANCVGCHRTGGIAPFSLETYEDALPVRDSIKAATADRRMPPWNPDNSGSCNTYENARWLSDDEIARIGAWADGGGPEGNPANAPTPQPSPTPIRVDAVAEMSVSYTPSTAVSDEYRCFVVDPGIPSTRYVTAHSVLPGDDRVVHHVVFFALDSAGEAQAVALDAQDSPEGYPCVGGSLVDGARQIGTWAPGEAASRFPAGTGIRLDGGRRMVMQLHYNTQQGTFPDRTRIELELEQSVAREAAVYAVANTDLYLPPGEPSITSSLEVDVPAAATVHGIFPHMHGLGRTLRAEYDRAGATNCMMDVPRWDWNWQGTAFFEAPVSLLPGDVVRLSCNYDTQGQTDVTTWGEGTEDEMCVMILYLTLGP